MRPCRPIAAAIKPRRDYRRSPQQCRRGLQMQGRLDEAASAYREAARRGRPMRRPFQSRRRAASDARARCRRSGVSAGHRAQPRVAVAHNNLGTVLKDQGRLDAALAAFEQAIELKADYAEAIYNRATVLQQQARLEEALAAYGQAISLRPDYVDAINNAGIVLQELGRAGDAIDLYRRLLDANAGARRCLQQSGNGVACGRRPDEARAAFEQALACRPDFPEAAYNLGNAWRELGDLGRRSRRSGAPCSFAPIMPMRSASSCIIARWLARGTIVEADQAKLLEMVRRGIRVPPFYLFSTPASAADQLLCARQWITPIKPPPKAVFAHRRCRRAKDAFASAISPAISISTPPRS